MPGVSAMRVASSALSRCLGAIAIGGDARQLALGLGELRLLDLAIDLEPAQLAEHRARLRGEPIGLSLQRADPRRGAIGLRLGIGLREERLRQAIATQATRATEAHEHAHWLSCKEPPCRVPWPVSANAPIILTACECLGIDYGARRIGLALSDATATLASPWRLVQRPPSDAETLRLMIKEIARAGEGRRWARSGGDRVAAAPRRHRRTIRRRSSKRSRARIEAQVTVPVVLQDERLSSHEAESRLAARESDWRKRKAKLDAAAAAIILQDYLDSGRTAA